MGAFSRPRQSVPGCLICWRPGMGASLSANCRVSKREFGLVTGRTAEFRFFSSSVRSGDTPGQILLDAERDLDDAGLLEVTIPALNVPVGQVVPVRVSPVVTELGILELWMRHTNSDRRWKVEFQVRTE